MKNYRVLLYIWMRRFPKELKPLALMITERRLASHRWAWGFPAPPPGRAAGIEDLTRPGPEARPKTRETR